MKVILTPLCFLCCSFSLFAQFDVAKYKQYVNERKELTTDQILREYDAGYFIGNTKTDYLNSKYYSDIQQKYTLTKSENELIGKHGFMVTSRISYPSYSAAFYDVYNKDLPVYISSDAILHALHRSYDNMLKYVEKEFLFGELRTALEKIHTQIAQEKSVKKLLTPIELTALKDADVYITVTRKLLNPYDNSIMSLFPEENNKVISELLDLARAEKMTQYNLFASQSRMIDFSQMKPRGHYTQDEDLKNYFRAMMWMGRTELYITAPKSDGPTPTEQDIQRQCALSVQIAQSAKTCTALHNLNTIDKTITSFVGAQDNLTTNNLLAIIDRLGITINSLQDAKEVKKFQDACIAEGASQKILSQILISNELEKIEPAAAYMVLGQRFIIDSYIFMNVVYDKVASRLMPSTLDAMFALGNNSALQLLKSELEKYRYAPQLAGLRYLIDSYGKDDWNSSLYATWLQSLRSLNPPDESKRKQLPIFMQTAAWWQKTLNTQLMSWAELRHDNLLYAKQSYTGGLGCFYPEGYVEPVPELYATVRSFAQQFKKALEGNLPVGKIGELLTTLRDYEKVMTTLESISQKELRHEELSEDERDVITNWIMRKEISVVCATETHYTGWYQKLLFGVSSDISLDKNPNFVVADVHTQPTDEAGNMVGKVLHVGTGAPSLSVIIANDNDDCSTAYCGPVGSYFEYISENFYRLTDEEWASMYESKGMRPSLTNLYMANNQGEVFEDSPSLLISSVDEEKENVTTNGVSYPNPFSSNTLIAFTVPSNEIVREVSVKVFSTNGDLIKEIILTIANAGNYAIRWDGTDGRGNQVANGAYPYTITINKKQLSGTVVLQRK